MSAPTLASTYGVHSEVGRLRKVLVCAPGLAHRRLTPTNSDDLLFDDVLWVENAQRDHAAFVADLRERGVEVVELHELLAETMAMPVLSWRSLLPTPVRSIDGCSTLGITVSSESYSSLRVTSWSSF